MISRSGKTWRRTDSTFAGLGTRYIYSRKQYYGGQELTRKRSGRYREYKHHSSPYIFPAARRRKGNLQKVNKSSNVIHNGFNKSESDVQEVFCEQLRTTKLRLFDLRKFQITRFRLPHARSKVCACAAHSYMANFNGGNSGMQCSSSVDFENYKFISLLEYSGDNRKVSRKKNNFLMLVKNSFSYLKATVPLFYGKEQRRTPRKNLWALHQSEEQDTQNRVRGS